MIRALAAAALVALLALAAAGLAFPARANARAPLTAPCPAPTVPTAFTATLRVPGQYPTIQAAVDAAEPGVLVLVAPGVYHEAVEIETPDLTLRGLDRNGVILEGGFSPRTANGIEVYADNVVIENLTARDYLANGFYWHGVTGYRGSYLTAYDNGDYGLYARASHCGQLDHSYASGSPDSGFYIGECYPCDAVITHVVAEDNALGYSGTNAGGNLIIRDSIWRHNGAGIAPNTLDSEDLAPQHGATITGNIVTDNGNAGAPSFALERPLLGAGIALPGGNLNYVAHNTIARNSAYGILVAGNIDTNLWLASGNVVEDNQISGSGIADLALAAPAGGDNCFSGNTGGVTLPPLLQLTHACGLPLARAGGGDPSVTWRLLAAVNFATGPNYHQVNYQTAPTPPAQPTMPDPGVGPAPALTQALPMTASGLPAAVPEGDAYMLTPFGLNGFSIVQVLLSLYANFLPFALYAAWVAIALWDIGAQEKAGGRSRALWALVVLVVPLLGPIAYYAFGGSALSRRFRLALVVGAPVIYVALAALLLVLSGYVA